VTEAETVPLIAQLAPFSSLFAAIIASASVLWVAYRVYPWQKSKDHAFELRKEVRQSYREFIEAWLVVQRQINSAQKIAKTASINDAIGEYSAAMRLADACVLKIGLTGSDTVVGCVAKMHDALYNLYEKFGLSLKESFQSGSKVGLTKAETGRLFGDAIVALKNEEMQLLEDLLFLMRSEEFGRTERLLLLEPEKIEFGELEEANK